VLTIYVLLQIVVQGTLGADLASFRDAPLAGVAQNIIGTAGTTILLITTAVSCFGSVSSSVLAAPRSLFAGANDGMFPMFLKKVHPRFATPYLAIITYGSLIFILSISGGFKQLAILASAAVLFIYLSVILASIKIRNNVASGADKAFTMPGGIAIPLIGIIAIVWLLTHLTKWELLSAILFIAAVCVIYFVMKQFRKKLIVEIMLNEITPQIKPPVN
jgi:basic amino acid/polyamine antiporter, APA family